jgi:hypothetical protein
MAAKKASRKASRKATKKPSKKRPSQAKKKASKAVRNAKKKVAKVTKRAQRSIAKVTKKLGKRVSKAKTRFVEQVQKKVAELRAPTVLQIGLIHEFGAPAAGIPARSFIRDWATEQQDAHKKQLRAIGTAVIKGKYSAEQGLKRFGVLAEGQVKKRIATGIGPALDESTVKAKGSSMPLIDTGQLRSSITHKLSRRKAGTTPK